MTIDLSFVKQSEFERLLGNNQISRLDKAEIVSQLVRINILYMIKKAGSGHIGTSFSSAEIMSLIYLDVLNEGDVFFSSKGHDAPAQYAVLTGIGRLDFSLIHSLRRLEGLPGHPDVETPHIFTNTGSLGMGISKAKGAIIAARSNNETKSVYVLTGDGELQEGQFWESLSGAVNGAFSEITVIVDHNKIQSDTWVENVNSLGNIVEKISSFGWHVQRCDGNSVYELSECIENAKKISDRPKLIIADTVKGKGVKMMESTSLANDQEFYNYHSGAPSDEDYLSAVEEIKGDINSKFNDLGVGELNLEHLSLEHQEQSKNIQRLIPAYEEALFKIGRSNPNVFVLDADLILDCGLIKFRDHFPDRFVECGIAEQDMVSQAGTLAIEKKIPVVHSFACFLAARANEQIYNNATEKTKCVYVGSLAGLLPSGPGHSHQMVRDISALGAMPGLTLMEPSCPEEVEKLLDYAINENALSSYIRLVSIPYELPYFLPSDYCVSKGKGTKLLDGSDGVIISHGPVTLSEAHEGCRLLQDEYGLSFGLINLPWLNEIDIDWLKQLVKSVNSLVAIDNGFLIGGQSQMLASSIAELPGSDKPFVLRIGIEEIPVSGTNQEALRFHGLDARSLAEKISSWVSSRKN